MVTLARIGYLLVGAGIGVLASTLVFERELSKPVGEVEEFVSSYDAVPDEEVDEENDTPEDAFREKSSLDGNGSVFERYISKGLDKGDLNESDVVMERRRDRKNRKTDYTAFHKENGRKMPKSEMEFRMNEAVEEEPASPPDDIPEEEPWMGDSGLVTDRVEENFEVYLDDHPQDYVTLFFYLGDYTMCDDREQLVPNPENIVGEVAINRLIEGGPGAEDGVIFVRNLMTMLNYEVVLDNGSYSETVLGIFEGNLDKRGGGHGGTR